MPIESEKNACPFAAARHQQRVDRQRDQDHEQQRHQHLGRAFDALLHAHRDDEMRRQHEQRGVDHGPPRVADKGLENGFVLLGGAVFRQTARQRMHHVFGGPSRHHEIEAQDQERRHDAVVAQEAPFGIEGPVGAHGVAVRGASDREFGHHDRQPQQQHAADVNQQKGSAAVVAGHVGKPPDVSQPHGTTCRDEHGAQFATQRGTTL